MMKPSEYFSNGYNCAESIIKCYNEEFNDNLPISIASGMGRGACSGSICGSINASIIIIGHRKGRNDNTETNQANKYVKELIKSVREVYSTEICKELKANKVSCAEIIDFSYDKLKKLLEC